MAVQLENYAKINFISTTTYITHEIVAVQTQNKDFLILHEQASLLVYSLLIQALFQCIPKQLKHVQHSTKTCGKNVWHLFNQVLEKLRILLSCCYRVTNS